MVLFGENGSGVRFATIRRDGGAFDGGSVVAREAWMWDQSWFRRMCSPSSPVPKANFAATQDTCVFH